MEALISGTLGTAALIRGDIAEVIWIDGRTKTMPSSKARSIQRNAKDIVYLGSCTKPEALKSLRSHWMKDRALMLMLILLDSTTPQDERLEIIQLLNDWLNNDDVTEYLKCVMYSKPLPDKDIILTDEIDHDSNIGNIVKDLFENQTNIQRIRENWNSVATYLSAEDQKEYEQRFIAIGAFYRLVSPSKKDIGELHFECLSKFTDLPNFREIINSFLSPFIELADIAPETTSLQSTITFPEIMPSQAIATTATTATTAIQATKSPDDQFKHIKQRMKIAASFFHSGEFDQANKVVNWLVDDQKTRGDFEHAAKTLCNVSEMAKNSGQYSLQLKYALQAHNCSPTDSRVLGHIGDAYLNLGQLENADTWFTRAINGEHKEYGLGGLVRVLRKKNKLQEAYNLILEVLENEDASLDAWIQKSEILRGLGRYKEAIQAYSETIKRYPYNALPLDGLAATNTDAGLYQNALDTYEKAISLFPENGVAYTAKGHLLARLGNLSQALPYLHRGIKLADDMLISVNALASALRINGKSGRAIKLLEKEIKVHPKSERTWSNLIESATSCGKYKEAKLWLANATRNLGSTSTLILQEVKILAANGNYKAALDLLDSLLDKHPRYAEASIEKLRLLRRLNRSDDALHEAKTLLKNLPHDQTIKMEATTLGLIDLPDDVVRNRAGIRDHATLEDWEYDRASSIILLNRHDAKSAWRISLDGKKRSPFKSQRKLFGLILAIARDLLGRTGSVANALKGYKGPEASIVKAISYWKLGLQKKLQNTLSRIQPRKDDDSQSDPRIIELFKLVSSRYNSTRDLQKVTDFENRILFQTA